MAHSPLTRVTGDSMRFIIVLTALLLAPAMASAAPRTYPSSAGPLAVEAIANGLVHPWSLAFLPDGRMLVTERPGRMRIVTAKGKKSKPLAGVPRVWARGQAGLMDVILDRHFADNRTIYFSYVEPYRGGGRIAIARAKLDEKTPRLTDVKVIFRQAGPPGGGANIGCRLVQVRNGDLFASQGDHFTAEKAQSLDNDTGKIIRIRPDGAIPPDNPFVDKKGARPEIWAYGVRNPEGLAINPSNGELWEQEHGPKGGDEINIIRKGANYGWPVVSFGVNYDGSPVGTGKRHHTGMVDSVWHWTPSIAPSGMAFYTGDLFPQWKGSLFNGALKYMLLSRLELNGDKVVKEERLLHGIGKRIRDVHQGPDGALYLLTDEPDGQILRVAPAKQ
jgi:aldose sugar dehydrogenase